MFKIKNFLNEKINIFIKYLSSSILNFFETLMIKLLTSNTKRNINLKKILNEKYLNLKENYIKNNSFELQGSKMIDTEFILDLAHSTQVMNKKTEINIDHGKILYSILYDYIKINKNNLSFDNLNIVEIGTAKGFSSICMAKCLNDMKINGKIFTFDIIDHRKKMLWNNIHDLDGKISRLEMLSKWKSLTEKYIVFISGFSHISLKKIYIGRIHFAFIDGSHFGHDIENEFNFVSKYQDKNDIIFFDDYLNPSYKTLTKKIDEMCETLNYSKKIINGKKNRNYLIAYKS